MLRINELPELDVQLVQSDAAPGGIGELAGRTGGAGDLQRTLRGDRPADPQPALVPRISSFERTAESRSGTQLAKFGYQLKLN